MSQEDAAGAANGGQEQLLRSRDGLLFLRPDRADYQAVCAASGLESLDAGWGAVRGTARDGKPLTLFTPDMEYMTELIMNEMMSKQADLVMSKFTVSRMEWPKGWDRPPSANSPWLAAVLVAFEFEMLIFGIMLAIPSVRAFLYWLADESGGGWFPPVPVLFGLAVLCGVLYIIVPLRDRPHRLIATANIKMAASYLDRVCVLMRLWAIAGVMIGLGGLGGLYVAHALAPSARHVLEGGAIGAFLAAAAGLARLISRRRSLGQEAVALLRRAGRTGAARLQDHELARLEVLLTACWIPGSRTSWMTAGVARDFVAELARTETERAKNFPACLERTLHWIENGSGLVGAFHDDVWLPKQLLNWCRTCLAEEIVPEMRDILGSRRRWFARTSAHGPSANADETKEEISAEA